MRAALALVAVLLACVSGWLAVDGNGAAATMTLCTAVLAGCEALDWEDEQ